MYVFTSAFFFIIFFSFVTSPIKINRSDSGITKYEKQRTKLLNDIKKETDSADRIQLVKSLARVDTLISNYKAGKIDTSNRNKIIGMSDLPDRQETYDSLQKKLPPKKKDGWLMRRTKHRFIAINRQYKGKADEFLEKLMEKFMHSFPQMLFLSVPLTALILQLLYVRRKEFYYVNHVIFILHFYIAAFIILLTFYGFSGLQSLTGWSLFTWLKLALILLLFFYDYKAMRNFYGQRRGKTILKFILFNITTFIVTIIITGIFFFTSLMQV